MGYCCSILAYFAGWILGTLVGWVIFGTSNQATFARWLFAKLAGWLLAIRRTGWLLARLAGFLFV